MESRKFTKYHPGDDHHCVKKKMNIRSQWGGGGGGGVGVEEQVINC